MSKKTSPRRVPGVIKVSPLIANYVQALAPVGSSLAGAQTVPGTRRVRLVSRTWQGVTVNRYQDGYEIIFSSGRKVEASSPLKLIFKMFRGAK